MSGSIGSCTSGAGLKTYLVMPQNGWENPPLQHKNYTQPKLADIILFLAKCTFTRKNRSLASLFYRERKN